jgi:hypothetical protein
MNRVHNIKCLDMGIVDHPRVPQPRESSCVTVFIFMSIGTSQVRIVQSLLLLVKDVVEFGTRRRVKMYMRRRLTRRARYPPAVWQLANVLCAMEFTKKDPCGLSSLSTTEHNRHRNRPYSGGIVGMYHSSGRAVHSSRRS